MKLTITGFVHKCEPPKKGKNNDTYYQTIVVREPSPSTELDKQTKDQYYPVMVFNKNPDLLHSFQIVGRRVEIVCYLNGKEVAGRYGMDYYLNLNLKELNFLSEK